MGVWARIKKKIPAGRGYMDRKFGELTKLLEKQQHEQLEAVRQYVDQELRRRDDWGKRAAETRRLAGEKQVWVIKCPAPDAPSKVKWGDYHYAVALKKYLERLELYVLLDTREDWDCEAGADVVLVLRGVRFYRPDRRNERCLYVMWNISHPDMVTDEEYNLYDVVCVASHSYATELAKRLAVPVEPLLQCTDTEVFCPQEADESSKREGYVFIGNSRGIARNCVMWAAEKKLPLRIWGTGWGKILGEKKQLVVAPTIDNCEIPVLYRGARATLNDHWPDMLERQFVNNRIFDALACGLPVISDGCEEMRKLFPGAVLCYKDREEFDACVLQVETDYEKVHQAVLDAWPVIQRDYSFAARAAQLVELVKTYRR